MTEWIRVPGPGHQWHEVDADRSDPGDWSWVGICGHPIDGADVPPEVKATLLVTDGACDDCLKVAEIRAQTVTERDPLSESVADA